MSHFYIQRYQRENAPVFPCPRVKEVELHPLNLANLRTVKLGPNDSLPVECKKDYHCHGHLTETSEGRILPPSFCIVDESEIKDQRENACQRYREGEISHAAFANNIRESLKGKTGLLRETLSVRPLISLQGVALCDWSLGKREVCIPRIWGRKLEIPFRQSEGEFRSSRWSIRSFDEENGEMGFLLSCLVVGDSSVQPVSIKLWDHLSIGVNPEMCAPLNLDFDGDEVKVVIVSEQESTDEIDLLMKTENLNTFDNGPALLKEQLGTENVPEDFMIGTTLCLSELETYGYNSPLAKLAKGNDASRRSAVNIPKTVHALSVDEMFERWEAATFDIVKSQLRVSEGHTFSRQFALTASTVENIGSVIRIPWQGKRSTRRGYKRPETLDGLTNPFSSVSYGFPGARLALRLSSRIFQELLDLDKSKSTPSDTRLIMSLFASDDLKDNEQSYYLAKKMYDVKDGEPLFRSFASIEAISENYVLVASTDLTSMSELYGSSQIIVSLMLLISQVVRKLSLRASRDEVFELAVLIFHTFSECQKTGLTSRSGTSFLSFTSNDALTSALCDNIEALELASLNTSRAGTNAGKITTRSLCTAIALGSFETLKERSIWRLRQGAQYSDVHQES
ncbi:hypothetical protein KEM54_001692 [Ascosphaera aggregata]|nr:hypothetical protein KEM54_001692 [Ascosphaera aggregata]